MVPGHELPSDVCFFIKNGTEIECSNTKTIFKPADVMNDFVLITPEMLTDLIQKAATCGDQ